MIEDDETRQQRAERHYKARRDAFVQQQAGLADEDLALLQETGLLDATDLNLLTAGAVKRGFDVLGGHGTAKRIREVERVAEDVDEIAKAGRRIFKLFRR